MLHEARELRRNGSVLERVIGEQPRVINVTHFKPQIMINIKAERLGEIALNDTKPQQAIKARCYIYLKAEQILGRFPKSLGEAVVAIIKYRNTGEMAR